MPLLYVLTHEKKISRADPHRITWSTSKQKKSVSRQALTNTPLLLSLPRRPLSHITPQHLKTNAYQNFSCAETLSTGFNTGLQVFQATGIPIRHFQAHGGRALELDTVYDLFSLISAQCAPLDQFPDTIRELLPVLILNQQSASTEIYSTAALPRRA